MKDQDLESSIAALEATGQFKVLRRAQLDSALNDLSAEGTRVAVIVDTETTGLDLQRDEIIEIGMIAFTYDRPGHIGNVIGTFSALQQPSKAIPPEVTKITGISNEIVAGKVIDKEALEEFLRPASLIVAHNAAFDRPMCERLSSTFAGKPWACSATEIDWRRYGFEGTKLGYILNQLGKFHSGHRAIDDCIALFNILRTPLAGTEHSAFAELLSCARKTRHRISVVSPFEMRNVLKARGYRWHPGGNSRPRSWWIEVDNEKRDSEVEFLTQKLKLHNSKIFVEEMTALNRYRSGVSLSGGNR
jgi:DNA polymerase-3 subunit epsilon